ncbi:MAG: site-2 protease family protein [Candidatus Omnitrophica bacterium]|jgi:Zn-dependent protease|nr:site-2 protease family protein [Candidatus Omnitrophota bacterium]
MISGNIVSLIISIPIFIFAMVIHEVAHGWVAYKLGDPTAKYSGRLTLNPISHIDPLGTILLPILLIMMNSPVVFGWAKPVPINFLGLRNPKRDIMTVGLAGPMANIIFAFILAAVFRLFPVLHAPVISDIFFGSILVNLVLAAFNLIPIPPLDGSRILFGLLPRDLAAKYMSIERYGFIILYILIWMGFLDNFVNPLVVILARIIGI